jgi:hypothetical protein
MKKAKSLSAWYRRTGAFKWTRRPRFTEPHFDPFAKSIGQLLLAWNDLHEWLATLFVSAMGGGWVDRPLSVWHKNRPDGGKRAMLKAAISHLTDPEIAGRTELVAEIEWILDVTQQLEGIRDNAAHTPLHAWTGSFLTEPDILAVKDFLSIGTTQIFPDTAFKNPRAMKLDQTNKINKVLLREYRYARERIIILRDYVIAIDAAWSNSQLSWPDRPSLPDRTPSRPSKGAAQRRRKK